MIDGLKSENAKALQHAQNLFAVTDIEGKFTYFKANFSTFTAAIARLQERRATLVSLLDVIKKEEWKLDNVFGDTEKTVKQNETSSVKQLGLQHNGHHF